MEYSGNPNVCYKMSALLNLEKFASIIQVWFVIKNRLIMIARIWYAYFYEVIYNTKACIPNPTI